MCRLSYSPNNGLKELMKPTKDYLTRHFSCYILVGRHPATLLDDFTGLELNQHFPYYFGRSHHIKLPGLLILPTDGLEPPTCPHRMGTALPTELRQYMVDPTGLEPVTPCLQGRCSPN